MRVIEVVDVCNIFFVSMNSLNRVQYIDPTYPKSVQLSFSKVLVPPSIILEFLCTSKFSYVHLLLDYASDSSIKRLRN